MYCQFALVSSGGLIERNDVAPISDLAELARKAQRTVAILAASDVTLLRVKLPPIPAARLKAALPNLVEDQLMSDPAECVVVGGDKADDLLTVAVVNRNWLEVIDRTLVALGARKVTAVPAQLCLPLPPDGVAAAVTEYGMEVEVAVRLDRQHGLGLPVFAELPEMAPAEVLQALAAVVPGAPVTLHVPQAQLPRYEDTLRVVPELQERIRLVPDTWSDWIEGADRGTINLLSGLGASSGPKMNWRPWRWPLALAAAVLLVNIVALNVDWLRMRREADALQASMLQSYKSAFPKETVIIDPLAQMRQKIAAAQRGSGQVAPDDFIALTSAFSEAWSGAGQTPQAIAGIDYRDRSLSVKLKPGTNVSPEQVQTALASRNLSLSQPSAGVWQIRSGK